jgi:uncharacterized phage infection (PIP) family protein YhgE
MKKKQGKVVFQMGIIKALAKNRLFVAGLFIPIIFQLVYFSFAIPAVYSGDTGVFNLKIAIVNEDTVMGNQIAGQLVKTLPFKTESSADLKKSLEDMDNGDCNMVIHIGGDFTARLQQGDARISYYIDQAASSMTKQLMETTAKSINQTLNDNAFNTIKDTIKQNSLASLGKAGLPAAVVESLGTAFGQAFNALKASPIYADIQKVHSSDGFVKTALPLFIFLTYFVGGVILAITHSLAYKSVSTQVSRGKLYLTSLVINIVYSLIIPGLAMSFIAGFNITLNQGSLATWMLLSVGFFTFISLFQMLFRWLGLIGYGAFVLILFPLQLVSSGLIYAREMLPAFYRFIADYLPATYFGGGILNVTYGTSLSWNIGILLLMAAIFIAAAALALLKNTKQPTKNVGVS